MNLHLYINHSDANVVDKDLTPLFTETVGQQNIDVGLPGTLKEDCSIIDPIITIDSSVLSMANIADMNYAYIPEFERSYFIRNMVFRGKLLEIQMHVDVLSTYKGNIRALSAIIARQEKKYNLYLQDGLLKQYANPHIEIKQFPNAFTEYEFIFSVVG